ncbi:hypothetical protein [Leptobacterium sp. I13]|uniref:hypothetical protein n=1 Tax=Leptobacterium meishanense TaxID=3128904 RepID=UPI0030ECFD54
MKKKLESELVSIAHRILKLKGKEDIVALQKEAKNVYEQLTILKFVEEHFGSLKPLVGKSEVVAKFEELAASVLDENKRVPESNPHEEDIVTPLMDTIKDMVAEMPKEDSLDDLLADYKIEPQFVEKEKVASKPISVQQKLKKGISIDLNDRIAFVKHLFNGSTEDFNRVVSQLNTIDNEKEALHFINDMIKPDYGNWKGKETYEQRLVELIQYKFN